MRTSEKSAIVEFHRASVRKYSVFHTELNDVLQTTETIGTAVQKRIEHLLNGAASEALTRLVDKKTRTAHGIFFSGKDIAARVANKIKVQIANGASIADPTCGAGDLLLACMRHAPVAETPAKTIRAWTKRIAGVDIHPQFVEVAKSRLMLLALEKTNAKKTCKYIDGSAFSAIRTGDFLEAPTSVSNADCIVMNPPFGQTETPDGCSWSSGKVQQAALFTMSVVQNAKSNQHIVAILPDVLRSGTRYSRWRNLINRECETLSNEIYGRFDSKTDVDVFILHLKKRVIPLLDTPKTTERKPTGDASIKQLDEVFTVSVGSVVPHRHKGDKGELTAYLTVHGASIDGEVSVSDSRRFDGKLHKAPFITLRRTSSPGDSRRAIPSLILGPEWIAVENHLVVVQPKDGSISTCRALMIHLQDTNIDRWLDSEIRCRHLTTRVLKQLPLNGWTE